MNELNYDQAKAAFGRLVTPTAMTDELRHQAADDLLQAIEHLYGDYLSLQAEVENLRKRNHDLHSNLTYNKAQVLALTERLQELDPPEEMHGT